MLILGVTTSTERCGVALWRGGEVLGETVFPGSRSCVEELVPRIGRLLEDAGLALRDVERFAVDVGPGGMTGLKIGVVAVKTLAQVTGAQVVPVSGTLALCHGSRGRGELLFPVVKCMKHEFFNAAYRAADGALEMIKKERLVNEELLGTRLAELAGEGVLALGDATEQAREVLQAAGVANLQFAEGDANYPSAVSVCEIAAAAEPKKYDEVLPNYLCLTNAERNFGVEV